MHVLGSCGSSGRDDDDVRRHDGGRAMAPSLVVTVSMLRKVSASQCTKRSALLLRLFLRRLLLSYLNLLLLPALAAGCDVMA